MDLVGVAVAAQVHHDSLKFHRFGLKGPVLLAAEVLKAGQGKGLVAGTGLDNRDRKDLGLLVGAGPDRTDSMTLTV